MQSAQSQLYSTSTHTQTHTSWGMSVIGLELRVKFHVHFVCDLLANSICIEYVCLLRFITKHMLWVAMVNKWFRLCNFLMQCAGTLPMKNETTVMQCKHLMPSQMNIILDAIANLFVCYYLQLTNKFFDVFFFPSLLSSSSTLIK